MKITITKGDKVYTMDKKFKVKDAEGVPNIHLNRIVEIIMYDYAEGLGHPLAYAAHELGRSVKAKVKIEGLVLGQPGVIY